MSELVYLASESMDEELFGVIKTYMMLMVCSMVFGFGDLTSFPLQIV